MFTPGIVPQNDGHSFKDKLIALALSNRSNSASDLLQQRGDNRARKQLGQALAQSIGGQQQLGAQQSPTAGGNAAPVQIAQNAPQQGQGANLSPLQQAQRQFYANGRIEEAEKLGTRIAQQKQQRAAQIEKVTTSSIQIADTLLNANAQDRETILDYYKQNPPEGFPPGYLERYRNAPDAVLQAERQRALTIQQRLAQSNTEVNQDLDQDKFGLAQEDTRADNARADTLADNTIRNTDSVIDDRTADNVRGDRTLNETIRNNKQTSADRAATLAAKAAGKPGGKSFNGDQSQAAVFADRVINSNDEIEQLVNQGFNPSNPGAPWVLKGQERRQYERAKREFINAVLRKESGAAIAPSEFDSAEAQYFPQFGDNKATRDTKEAARKRAANGMRAQSQGAYVAFFGEREIEKEEGPSIEQLIAEKERRAQGG